MRILLTLTLLLAPTLLADPEPRRVQPAPAKAKKANSRTLWGIKWYDSLEGARGIAGKDERKPKPVLWLRMLGDLAGKS